jgi:hypothetical protein
MPLTAKERKLMERGPEVRASLIEDLERMEARVKDALTALRGEQMPRPKARKRPQKR